VSRFRTLSFSLQHLQPANSLRSLMKRHPIRGKPSLDKRNVTRQATVGLASLATAYFRDVGWLTRRSERSGHPGSRPN
jgi:hypothetical protein